jgi:hypothetical protein
MGKTKGPGMEEEPFGPPSPIERVADKGEPNPGHMGADLMPKASEEEEAGHEEGPLPTR